MLDPDNGDISIGKLVKKNAVPMLHQIKVQFFYWFRSLSTVLSPTENSRIQGIFKAFE